MPKFSCIFFQMRSDCFLADVSTFGCCVAALTCSEVSSLSTRCQAEQPRRTAKAARAKEHATSANSAISEEILMKRKPCDSTSQILVIGFNSHRKITETLLKSPLAQDLLSKGVDVTPDWANGATVLINGLTSHIYQKSSNLILKLYLSLPLPLPSCLSLCAST